MRKLFLFLIILVTFLFVGQASAFVITYDNISDFLSDTGALTNGAIPDDGNVGTSETLGVLTLSADNNIYFGTDGTITFVDLTSDNDWTSLNSGPDIAISGIEDLDIKINLVGSIYAAGFVFVEPTTGSVNVIPGEVVDSLFQIDILDTGDNIVDSLFFNAPDDQAYFFGVWTDYAISALEIQEIIGSHDNEFFGEFYLGDKPAPVPEPATMLLLGTGLIGLAGISRKKFYKK